MPDKVPSNKYHPPGKIAVPFSPQLQEVLEKIIRSRAPNKSGKLQRQLAEAQRLSAEMLLTANKAMFNRIEYSDFEGSIHSIESFVITFFGDQ